MVEGLGERVLGRVTATDVHKPGKDEKVNTRRDETNWIVSAPTTLTETKKFFEEER